jgi:transcriptional regulator with GAF, ATPase, and Fis domain
MARLQIKSSDGKQRAVPLSRRVTSLGRSEENDIHIDDVSVPLDSAAIVFDGKKYSISASSPFRVNGLLVSNKQLFDGDVIEFGQCQVVFVESDAPAGENAAVRPGRASSNESTLEVTGTVARELSALKRLTTFSERLLHSGDVNTLLENLMDGCIEVTRADKGYLLLMEANQWSVKVARNIDRATLENSTQSLSDSIVEKVVRSRKALVVADALDDPEFNASESVVNLKLLSVMCAPLLHHGELFGAIYLGNDRLVNRFDQKALDTLTIFTAQASLLIQNALLVDALKLENTSLKHKLEEQTYGEVIGSCAGMKDVYRRIDKVSPTDISVLILGETGTGKELIAKEIHRRSPRSKGPFVTINCGAIPENLLESELFGHVKGAFTGAVATKLGKFQAAIGGTLFLDEIGEMPLTLQVKLLRALQEKVVYKVGDTRAEPVDIRVVAATHKNLEDEVRRGQFREDLFFRINVVTLKLPPLRERGDDLALLAKFLLTKFAAQFNSKARSLSPAAFSAMKRYHWPGNIRELENRLKKAVVFAEKPLIAADDLDLTKESQPPILALAQAKEEFQKRYINEVLERNNGNRTKTAKDLGVDPRTVFRHLEKLEAEREGRTMAPEPEFDEAPVD